MALKIYKPTTPGRRKAVGIDYSKEITTDEPYRPLTVALKKRVARNNYGRITVRFRANPTHRRLYRIVDFKRDKLAIPAKVETIEYDPNRSAFIMLVVYQDGQRRYHLAPQGIKVGDKIITDEKTPIKPGNRMLLKNINPGTSVYNIEMVPGSGGKLVRSAGSSATILGFEDEYALLKMPSGEIRKIHGNCYASIGVVSNPDHRNIRLGKAGKNIHRGRRPNVRGSAMNARDHPYGGGEGKTTRGTRRPKDKWGNITGGKKTRNPRKPSNKLIVRRRPTKRGG